MTKARALRRRARLTLALLILTLAGVAAAQPKVALVLGGGAARGTAHVGVLQALTEAGVPIDMILGTSMGSLIGGLYAAGFSVDTLDAVVGRVDPTASAEFLLPPRGGILDGAPLGMLLDALVEGRRLDEAAIPFYPVVIDLATGVPGPAPANGSLAAGIRASTAIPVLFDPVLIDGAYYYDGGLKQTIPTSLARSLGATYVIAVDVTREIPFEPGNVQANFSRIVVSIVEEYNRGELEDTDVVLDPGLRDFSYMDFDLTSDFVRAGARVAERELPRILADLAALGIPLRPGGDPNRGRSINDGWEGRLRAAQRAVVTRARPWNLAVDLALAPAARGERVTPAPAPVGSRVRLGVELRDGFLGGGAMGVSYARSVTGGSDALGFRASYRISADWRVFATVDAELGGAAAGDAAGGGAEDGETGSAAGVAVRGGVAVRLDDAWTATFALGYPSGVVDAAVAYRAPGVWLDANAAWGTAGWWRGYGVARGATALGGAWDLRGRAFAGASGASTPAQERFSVGPAIGLRGTPPDAFTAAWATVVSVELVRRLGDGAAVLEAATILPSVWAFADGAAFEGGRGAALGLGAGLEGRLFGFLPFAVALDVGYGLTTDSWRTGLSWGATFPTAAGR